LWRERNINAGLPSVVIPCSDRALAFRRRKHGVHTVRILFLAFRLTVWFLYAVREFTMRVYGEEKVSHEKCF